MAAHPKHSHLPADRAPGAQSRRRKGNRRLGVWMSLVLGVAMVAASVLFFTGTVESEDPTGAGVGCAVAGALFLLAAPLIARFVGRSRRAGQLELTAAPSVLSRGDEVRARLRISDTSKPVGEVEVGLVCVELYDLWVWVNGRRQLTTRESVAWETWQAARQAEPLQEFRFAVPHEAPFSYEGQCLSMAWRVTAREDRQARRDPRSDEPIWTRP